ncbi:MAG: insulinase family protein, partial [Sphingomonadales bacterium]|nr:insulinase family protein [Sphingomonadales bacterium]
MKLQQSTLPNGLRVVTETVPHLESATIGVWADVGARHEPEPLNGVAHMLEHMAFKGTTRRSARAIAEEIEAVGGYLNAYTSREHTVYYARVLKDNVALAVDLLSDILLHSTFDPD